MGDEISMKTRILFFTLMLCSASLASNSQAEMEHYDQLFSAINEQRKGLSELELKSLSDPFLKIKNTNHDNNGSLDETFDLQAIFNNKAKINGKWYQAKDNVGEYELASIKSKSVTLINKDEKIDLNLTKGANKNVVIKIK
ncbi:hypothetical protein H7R39_08320 [Campylobacter sp. Marseille-Q3452]|uniref:Transformation system protein n=2 Tax=Campylobacter massiliensis TaxID=2762557 RepID=A0A842J614_9BACT|nr:hypothetical protein [Campylobacter massiliensis]